MRDARRPPFCFQTVTALAAVRGRFDGRSEEDGKKLNRCTALAVYTVMTELANEQRTRDNFSASHKAIADRAGTTRQTVIRYIGGLVEAGVVLAEGGSRGDGGTAPNRYSLVDPPVASSDTAPVDGDDTPVASDTKSVVSDDTSFKKEEVGDSLRSSPLTARASARDSAVERARELWPSASEAERKVLTALVAVAKARDVGEWDPQKALDTCRRYPDRDHAAEAADFAFQYVEGKYENVPVKSLTGRWATWIRHASSGSKRAPRRRNPEQQTARDERIKRGLDAIKRLKGST